MLKLPNCLRPDYITRSSLNSPPISISRSPLDPFKILPLKFDPWTLVRELFRIRQPALSFTYKWASTLLSVNRNTFWKWDEYLSRIISCRRSLCIIFLCLALEIIILAERMKEKSLYESEDLNVRRRVSEMCMTGAKSTHEALCKTRTCDIKQTSADEDSAVRNRTRAREHFASDIWFIALTSFYVLSFVCLRLHLHASL